MLIKSSTLNGAFWEITLEPREIKKTIYKYVWNMSVISKEISAQFR